MIGSYAGLTFNDFVINLTPVVIGVMVAQIIYNKFLYGADYHRAKVEDVPKMIAFLKEKYKITDSKTVVPWRGSAPRSHRSFRLARNFSHGGICCGPFWSRSHSHTFYSPELNFYLGAHCSLLVQREKTQHTKLQN